MLSFMPLLVPLILIFSIALFYAIYFNRKINETLFLASVTIIFIFYICGLLNFRGSLLIGYALVIILALYGLIYARKKYRAEQNLFSNISLKTAVITILVFLAISLLINYGRLFYIWDEFTHWGAVVKHMYLFDALSTHSQSTIANKAYMPGTSIFQYFWARPFPVFTEYPAFVASNMLFYSVISTFVTRLNYRNLIIIGILLFVPLTFDYNLYNTLYVDSFLSIFFGAALLFYFYFRYEESIYGMLMVAAAVGMLTITKEAALIFALVLVVIIAFDLIIYKRREIKDFFAVAQSMAEKFKNILLLTSPFLAFALIIISWRALLASLSIRSGASGINLQRLLSLREEIMPHQVEIINAFKNALFDRPLLPFGLSYLHIIAALILVILAVTFLSKKGFSLNRQITVILLSILGSIVYIAARFVFYLLVFGQTAGPQLASFERYVISYMAGIFVALPIFLLDFPDLNILQKKNNRGFNKYFWLAIPVAALTLIIGALLFLPANIKDRISRVPDFFRSRLIGASIETTVERRDHYNMILSWSPYISEENSYYLVAQGHRGYSMRAFNYILYPHLVFRNSGHVDPSQPGEEANEWGNNILENYDYLYLFITNQVFNETYGHFFDQVEGNMLYRVTSDENGVLALQALKNIN